VPGPPSNPDILVLADDDDAGVSRLVSSLKARFDVAWWRFGLPESSVSVDLGPEGFRLEQPDGEIRPPTLRHTPVIVHRRRFLQARPLVASELEGAADRAFSEREWGSLIEGLLLAEERHSDSTWLNSPSAALRTANKLSLLLFAAQAGLPVPPFSISTPVRFPRSRGELVVKAISADERIDESRQLTTALLSPEDLRDLPGARIPTPSLLQEYVPAEMEIRVFYALGELFALALRSPREHVDIRHVPRSELSPVAHELPSALRESLAGVAAAFGLGYCTFDLVVAAGEPPALVDVTPNGDWDYFESDEAPVVTEFLAEAIAARVSSGRAGEG
jgi:hypothetical protein